MVLNGATASQGLYQNYGGGFISLKNARQALTHSGTTDPFDDSAQTTIGQVRPAGQPLWSQQMLLQHQM
jgi:hypothetical protein